MTRRYADVEPKLVADLVPGDEVVIRKSAVAVTRWITETGGQVDVTWSDGTADSYDLTVKPALEVVVRKDAE